ncbi:tyrosine/serine/threonine protein phosphatase pps1 [Orbilia oligospora]|uniref:Tyrosine/serine/threonine protein phosphatase pps1 n=1 Tax=Orbilia oligospora TaxID=2813651 RepID=A0A7C8NQ72_ORBOL|nr:tyrosine/serine/threonine protein phosphatase pps1 [Orbilia oligospora]KAF3098282.1 tyrosine/serine/threonine protein phosphatase pps1 [Orbilia oligospora]KAF3116544.1 tyrosine/serine/threonine protein phosphatase pps1 [Orbilia oligospora]KAF3120293.1 tyrosine/serine/threonine protein phosphatase pps1 [Orbilia oligospora]KAF3126613.1 tyrosine/serine/threonine protein phosphatase pps1 [Orbilia oligospora]
MATATLTLSPSTLARSITPPPSPPEDSPSPMALALASSVPLAIPNKHLPTPTYTITTKVSPSPVTPPASPPTEKATPLLPISSVLYPPSAYQQISVEPPIYSIDAATAAAAIHQAACHPLPPADKVFPWLHGLHSDNAVQLTFFNARRKIHQRTPSCWRGVTVVKAGRALESSKLRGAVHPAEILPTAPGYQGGFLEVDPKEGFCVRNFHIQTAKLAAVSDIIVYGDDRTSKDAIKNIARRIAQAQVKYRSMHMSHPDLDYPQYNTFVVSSPFSEFEQNHPELVAFDSRGLGSGSIPDFPYLERQEMCTMSRATEIAHNVWLGSTSDKEVVNASGPFNICIESCDGAPFPTAPMLRLISRRMRDHTSVQDIEFPASGSVATSNWAKFDIDAIIDMCRWIYFSANPIIIKDADGDTAMEDHDQGKRVLVHCMDGYTETSLLALAYLMYSEGLPVHDAWIHLHREKGRNFFAYQTDLQILLHAQTEILKASPALKNEADATAFIASIEIPKWVPKLDGSLPSRILPHMYLGNLGHANNPEMLKELGIKRILSIGEFTNWSADEISGWPSEKIMKVENIQDNGVDPLTCRLDKCLDFINAGREAGEATLVHCRVGVSRSATICIAEVMKRLNLSVPRAYCYVRARRLNVIIQPHLRFMYELLKWEEAQRTENNLGIKRELEWPSIAREIALMNRPYSR